MTRESDTSESDKVMFEIYRSAGSDERHQVVYFTELDDHHRDAEIQRAMSGTHVYDGFLDPVRLPAAKIKIQRWLQRLDGGEAFEATVFQNEFAKFLVE